MKTAQFTMVGGRSLVEAGLETDSENLEKYGVVGFRWHLAEGDPVEGVVVDWEFDGDDAHLTVLMADDHAARFAVAPESGDAGWLL